MLTVFLNLLKLQLIMRRLNKGLKGMTNSSKRHKRSKKFLTKYSQHTEGSFHVRSPKKMKFEAAPPQILIKLYTVPLCDYNRRPVIFLPFFEK